MKQPKTIRLTAEEAKEKYGIDIDAIVKSTIKENHYEPQPPCSGECTCTCGDYDEDDECCSSDEYSISSPLIKRTAKEVAALNKALNGKPFPESIIDYNTIALQYVVHQRDKKIANGYEPKPLFPIFEGERRQYLKSMFYDRASFAFAELTRQLVYDIYETIKGVSPTFAKAISFNDIKYLREAYHLDLNDTESVGVEYNSQEVLRLIPKLVDLDFYVDTDFQTQHSYVTAWLSKCATRILSRLRDIVYFGGNGDYYEDAEELGGNKYSAELDEAYMTLQPYLNTVFLKYYDRMAYITQALSEEANQLYNAISPSTTQAVPYDDFLKASYAMKNKLTNSGEIMDSYMGALEEHFVNELK
jgi:hypothetical protein